MHLNDHPNHDGKQVWLSGEELDALISQGDTLGQSIVFELMGRSGLRREESLSVTPHDVVDGPAQAMVRVREGKGDKYRETPVPDALRGRIEGAADSMTDDTDSIVDVHPSTVNRWVERAAEQCRDRFEDDGWQYVTPHDFRRSWAQALLDSGVEPGMVMTWGGWEDWPTFRDHYLGQWSPKKQREEREKVNWL